MSSLGGWPAGSVLSAVVMELKDDPSSSWAKKGVKRKWGGSWGHLLLGSVWERPEEGFLELWSFFWSG